MQEHVWYNAYHPQVPQHLDLEDLTLPEMLDRTARRFPERTAIIYLGRHISYGRLNEAVNRLAGGLKAAGISRGEKVSLVLPNIPQIVMVYYALWRIGAVPVPNNPLYTDREFTHQLKNSGSTSIIGLDLLMPRLQKLAGECGIVRTIYCHINDYLKFPLNLLFPYLKKDMYRKFEPGPGRHEFMALAKHAPLGQSTPPGLDDLALLPYTGGTTGVSKGVALTHRNCSAIVQLMRAWFFDWQDQPLKELAVFPFFHLAGFTAVMNLSILNGWTMVLVPRPEAKTIFETIVKFKTEIVLAVPTIYVGLLNLPEFKKADLSFVQGFFSGAAPLALDTINALKKATGADIVEGFGMTESTALVAVTPWHGQLKPGSVGVPLPNTELRIMDLATGTRVMPIGEEGEIVFRGPQQCQGYYNSPAETADALRDGWFYTGDIGKMDEDGYFYVVDRKKDMIIAGGFNIFPREIEEVLYEHPKILEACAIGVPHEYRGETVKVFVVAKPGETLTEPELDAFCRERLTPYKVPKIWAFVEALPKSAIGKILRRELRDRERQQGAGK
jgi:long-chain acyl-CoA synthetase